MRNIITAVALAALTFNAHAYGPNGHDTYEGKKAHRSYEFNTRLADRFENHPISWLSDYFRKSAERVRDNYAQETYGDYTTSGWVTPEIRDAWIKGYTGKDTRIAVIDSLRHGHAYVTSSIAGGTNNHEGAYHVGIAPDAEVSIHGIGAANNVNNPDIFQADVVNMSFGATVDPRYVQQTTFTKLNDNWRQDYIETGRPSTWVPLDQNDVSALITISAGNDGSSCLMGSEGCSNVALTWVNSQFKDQTLVVGSVNKHNQITSYSNRAGILKDNFVVDSDNYEYNYERDGQNVMYYTRGTSFASPTVAGKAAIIKSKFNELNSTQIANIIKNTADDLGAPGVDAIYGHGRVNLTRALSPVGSLN